MESKFMALAAAGKKAEWLRNLILEIPLWSKPIAPISVCCDSVATLAKAYSQIYGHMACIVSGVSYVFENLCVFYLHVFKWVEWLRNLILEILLWSKPIAPISIRCDSVATLAKAYSQMYNGKSRHLGVRHSMIRELIMNGVVSIEFVRSQQNLADHLTKGLARDLVLKSAEGMGLKSN
ncbi:hypothetical protein Tco_0740169 [Tanacetum coccineum]